MATITIEGDGEGPDQAFEVDDAGKLQPAGGSATPGSRPGDATKQAAGRGKSYELSTTTHPSGVQITTVPVEMGPPVLLPAADTDPRLAGAPWMPALVGEGFEDLVLCELGTGKTRRVALQPEAYAHAGDRIAVIEKGRDVIHCLRLPDLTTLWTADLDDGVDEIVWARPTAARLFVRTKIQTCLCLDGDDGRVVGRWEGKSGAMALRDAIAHQDVHIVLMSGGRRAELWCVDVHGRTSDDAVDRHHGQDRRIPSGLRVHGDTVLAQWPGGFAPLRRRPDGFGFGRLTEGDDFAFLPDGRPVSLRTRVHPFGQEQRAQIAIGGGLLAKKRTLRRRQGVEMCLNGNIAAALVLDGVTGLQSAVVGVRLPDLEVLWEVSLGRDQPQTQTTGRSGPARRIRAVHPYGGAAFVVTTVGPDEGEAVVRCLEATTGNEAWRIAVEGDSRAMAVAAVELPRIAIRNHWGGKVSVLTLPDDTRPAT